jgi:ankyrin repeat protein
MTSLSKDEALAVAVTGAIQSGEVELLTALLAEHPWLTSAVVVDEGGCGRTLLHLTADFPGHLPRRAETATALVRAGAPVGGRFQGWHSETALHWAASNDDVELLDTLLGLGADLEADGGVIGNGTALADAVAFGQWHAARRLLEHGASTTLWQAAALGLAGRVEELAAGAAQGDLDNALWCACHGGQRWAAEYLLSLGADLNWLGHDQLTPLGAALRAGHSDLAGWLRAQGAR